MRNVHRGSNTGRPQGGLGGGGGGGLEGDLCQNSTYFHNTEYLFIDCEHTQYMCK